MYHSLLTFVSETLNRFGNEQTKAVTEGDRASYRFLEIGTAILVVAEAMCLIIKLIT